jgi:hypothetical protein
MRSVNLRIGSPRRRGRQPPAAQRQGRRQPPPLTNAFTEASKELRVVPQQAAELKLRRNFNLVLNEKSPGHFGMVSPDVELPN